MNHAFQLAARAVFLSNNSDIEKFSFELPYLKPNVSVNSANSSVEDDGSTGENSYFIKDIQRIKYLGTLLKHTTYNYCVFRLPRSIQNTNIFRVYILLRANAA